MKEPEESIAGTTEARVVKDQDGAHLVQRLKFEPRAEAIVAAYRAGKPPAQIKQDFKISNGSLYRMLHAAGVELNQQPVTRYSAEEKARHVEAYRAAGRTGGTAADYAKKIDVPMATFLSWLDTSPIAVRDPSPAPAPKAPTMEEEKPMAKEDRSAVTTSAKPVPVDKTGRYYTEPFKNQVMRAFIDKPEDEMVQSFAKRWGIPSPVLYQWRAQGYPKSGRALKQGLKSGTAKLKRQHRSDADRLALVAEFRALPPNSMTQTEFARRRGVEGKTFGHWLRRRDFLPPTDAPVPSRAPTALTTRARQTTEVVTFHSAKAMRDEVAELREVVEIQRLLLERAKRQGFDPLAALGATALRR